jgi:hypothetical protein
MDERRFKGRALLVAFYFAGGLTANAMRQDAWWFVIGVVALLVWTLKRFP